MAGISHHNSAHHSKTPLAFFLLSFELTGIFKSANWLGLSISELNFHAIQPCNTFEYLDKISDISYFWIGLLLLKYTEISVKIHYPEGFKEQQTHSNPAEIVIKFGK